MSKTLNMPANTTVEQVSEMYLKSHKFGLKAVALYRDGCKVAQPVVTSNNTSNHTTQDERKLERRKLPDVRHNTSTVHVSAGSFSCYVHVGRYDNGLPGEVFFNGKEGSTIGGLLSGLGRVMSIALQFGVPFEDLLGTLAYNKFEPSGFTNHPIVRFAHSPLDAIARVIAAEEGIMLPGGDWSKIGPAKQISQSSEQEVVIDHGQVCSTCGQSGMERAGSCYRCTNCGSTTGCG
jgi:ribonucleoside-diphosphate reductase alpha chain